ncbi:MAG TPA: pilus assembly protein TadG-related protein, partial [Propionibacteriaceae bacterium]|nr:pilus assembly protein TadG-related protein [Propionibacteriaceae bacterium]
MKARPTHIATARPRERGQVLVLALIFVVVVLLGIAAMVVDVGYAYYAHRSLQSSADAAALAGAQELPNVANATSAAKNWGGSSTGKNAHNNIPGVSTNVTTKCINSLGPCTSANAIVVTETSTKVPTIFAKVVGIDHFSISAKATAAMGFGVPKPAHIMVIFDRTGSMNQSCSAGGNKALCVRNGIKAFLTGMDPAYNKVGLIVYPPGNGNPCTFNPHNVDAPTTDYDAYPNGYLAVPLSNDYKKADGTLNTSSSLVSTVNCIKAQGTTATAPGIDKAQQVL